jgi:hypothetical protein
MMDRRALFFIVAAIACAVLVFPAPKDLRWVPGRLAVLYVVLAVASFLDHLSRRNS